MDYPAREEIRSLCTEQSFERGVNYYHQDRVQELEVDGDEIRATVRGSNYYDVAIDIVDDGVRSHCSCPYDYAGDCKIDRLFDDAVSRRGMVEYGTHIDFSQYTDVAETHRERGHVDTATDIYRAVSEAIRENLDRVDDSSEYYGREVKYPAHGGAGLRRLASPNRERNGGRRI
nr:hypothetical protein [Halapricum desulfuricans]